MQQQYFPPDTRENLPFEEETIAEVLKKAGYLTAHVPIEDNGGFTNPWENQVVTSNYPLRSGKGALYEGGVRIPMIVRFPGTTEPGTVCDQAVSTMDL